MAVDDGMLNLDTPFMNHLMDEAERQMNGEQVMMVNGSPMGQAIWNLICSKRDLTLWCNIGMKPHRHWKVTDVKRYFGIKGHGQALLDEFMTIYDELMGGE